MAKTTKTTAAATNTAAKKGRTVKDLYNSTIKTTNDKLSAKLTNKFGESITGMKDGMFKNLATYATKNPLQTAGMAGLGIANIPGLVNDDNILGQLLGGAAGAAIPYFMGAGAPGIIASGLAGGLGGSLIDTLIQSSQDREAEDEERKLMMMLAASGNQNPYNLNSR